MRGNRTRRWLPAPALFASPAACAADGAARGLNVTAVTLFIVFVAITLVVTWRAAARSSSSTDNFYAAGNRIGGFTNGLAIAGDFMSAATFLGISGLIFMGGFDGIIYMLSPLVGFGIMLFAMAEPFRNLGRFTLGDVASYRLSETPLRIFAAVTSLMVVILYLVVQLVGAGTLVQVLFSISFPKAVVITGVLTTIYVSFGGMIATTWVQVIKAVLMIAGITYMSIAVMNHFSFDMFQLYAQAVAAHTRGADLLRPGGFLKDPVSTISLALALVIGFCGLPHLLMRLFTVPDGRQARLSLVYATGLITYVFILIFFIVAFGAIVLVPQYPEFYDTAGKLIGGNNMVAIHLSKVLGGDIFLGIISAICFATILAVVCGLMLAGASAVSHDIYARTIRRGHISEKEEVLVTRVATVLLGLAAIGLSIVFEKQNIAYMVSLVFVVSGSASFPVLILSLYWRNLTTRGAVGGGTIGLVVAITLMVFGPTVWVDVLGHAQPIFPYKYPVLFSSPLAFACIWLISKLDRSERAQRDREQFDEMARIAFRNVSHAK